MNFADETYCFVYCFVSKPVPRHISPPIFGSWNNRWTSLRSFFNTWSIPIVGLSEDQPTLQNQSPDEFSPLQGLTSTREDLTQLLSSLVRPGRTRILVAGSYAETLISDAAVTALEEGYDAYVVWDRVWALSEIGVEAAKLRLTQFGAVPTTVDQILHLWR